MIPIAWLIKWRGYLGGKIRIYRLWHIRKRDIRTCTDVVPVGVVGSKLLEGAGFDKVNPGGHLELARTLEVGCVCRDEGLRAVDDTSPRARSDVRSPHYTKQWSAPDVSYARHFEWWGKEERLPWGRGGVRRARRWRRCVDCGKRQNWVRSQPCVLCSSLLSQPSLPDGRLRWWLRTWVRMYVPPFARKRPSVLQSLRQRTVSMSLSTPLDT